jgi:predicted DNA-binding transcriptional regulator AlpA
MRNDAHLPDTGFVRLPTILRVFPVSRSTWWDMVRDGRAPAPVKLTERCTAWRADDIRALLERTAKAKAAA